MTSKKKNLTTVSYLTEPP